MSAPVFLTQPGDLRDVVAGGTYLLDGAEGRHAATVRRSASLSVCGDGERMRKIVSASRDECGYVP